MDLTTLTNEKLHAYIPNVVTEVEGETPLLDKLMPFMEDADAWLTANIVGSFEVTSSNKGILQLVEKSIVKKAFADAIPSLDLILSPSGFGVVSTDQMAPASKDRVERLRESTLSSFYAVLNVLVVVLEKEENWRKTEVGRRICRTFYPSIADCDKYRTERSVFDTWIMCRNLTEAFEAQAAEEFLGRKFLPELRKRFYARTTSESDDQLIEYIIIAEHKYISAHLADTSIKCPDRHELYHLCEPIVRFIQSDPVLNPMWVDDGFDQFYIEPFKNDVKGAYFF